MTDSVPLSRAAHGSMGWRAGAARRVHNGLEHIAVSLDELQALALNVPIVFKVAGDLAEPVIPVKRASGLFCDRNSVWLPQVLPTIMQSGPFTIAPSPKGELVLIDTAAAVPLVAQEHDLIPFFGEGEDLHPVTLARVRRLSAWRHSHLRARRAAGALLRAECLRVWFEDDPVLQVIDDAKLAGLSAQTAGELHQTGALRLAHLSLVSLGTQEANGHDASSSVATDQSTDDPFLAALRKGYS